VSAGGNWDFQGNTLTTGNMTIESNKIDMTSGNLVVDVTGVLGALEIFGSTGNFKVQKLAGSGTADVQANNLGFLSRATSDESTKRDFVVGEGVPGLNFVLDAAKGAMSFYYKDSTLNANIPYWGFSANKVVEEYGENPAFRMSDSVYYWDRKNMLAPLYKAIEEQQAQIVKQDKEIEDLKLIVADLIGRIETLEQ
jgi:hypothetical protein